jgi:penicillin amidase
MPSLIRVAIVGIAAALLTSLSLGQTGGKAAPTVLQIDGDSVSVVRDSYGIPHVFAVTKRGLFYGQGYAVAEDRLGQLDLYRRNARGDMAALVGKSALASDKETRLDGYTEAERQAQFDRQPAEIKVMVQSYADGINAYLAELKKNPIELKIANYPAKFDLASYRPWKVTDTLAISQMMGRRFGGDQGGELRNQTLYNVLKKSAPKDAAKIFNDIAWRNDPASPVTQEPADDPKAKGFKPKLHWTDENGKVVSRHAERSEGPAFAVKAVSPQNHSLPATNNLAPAIAVLNQTARLDLAQKLGLPTKWGSYCIAISKEKSATGNALLMGGPQMGFRTPQIAHEIHLSGAGIDCIGMGFAGIPGVLIGHNQNLAWSTTTGVADQTDVFVETLDPHDPTRYKFKGEWKAMDKREETIEVVGEAPVKQEYFRTVHGPVIQVDKANNVAYTRQATYWDKEFDNVVGFYRFLAAKNVREFGEACSGLMTSHNFFAADQKGDIGYWFCGRSPLRDPSIDPRLPTPGDGNHEWRGLMPFSDMPHGINPKQGFFVNWNNKPAIWWDNVDTPVWGEVWHSARISQLLAAKPKIATEDIRRILLDIGTYDYNSYVLIPLLAKATAPWGGATDSPVKQAANLLANWDGHAREGSIAETVFTAWVRELREELFGKQFGFIKFAGGQGLFDQAMQPSLIAHVLKGKSGPVPPQFDHLGGKKPEEVILAALDTAVTKLEKERGPDMARWTFTRGQINFSPLPGIPATDRGTYIQIVEVSPTSVIGVNILPPGQSERTDSPHFSDQRDLAGWFQFKAMKTKRADIEGK